MARARRKLEAGKLGVGFPAARDEAVLNAGGIRMESVLWNFAVDGAADADFQRRLPAGVIVKRVTVDVQTAVTGATDAVLRVGTQAMTGSVDLTALSGIAAMTLTDADGVKTSAAGNLKLDFTAAPTAGKIRIFVEYLLPND